MMITGGVVRTTVQVVMKNLRLLPHYQQHRQMCIQRTHGFNSGRSKLYSFLTAIYTFTIHCSTCRARGDRHQRDLRYASMHSAWHDQLPSLVDAYLLWKHGEHRPATAPEESQDQMEHDFHVIRVGVFGAFFFLSHAPL